MTPHYNAVVLLDHHAASIVHFNKQPSDGDAAPDPSHHQHVTDGNGQDRGTAEMEFFRDVADACDKADTVLLVGSPAAKLEFIAFLRQNAPQTAGRIAEVEAVDYVVIS